jgi:hypothetical protein
MMSGNTETVVLDGRLRGGCATNTNKTTGYRLGFISHRGNEGQWENNRFAMASRDETIVQRKIPATKKMKKMKKMRKGYGAHI